MLNARRDGETETAVGWWRAQGRQFVVGALAIAAVVVVGGWMTELRQVMHGALLALAVAAFLPFMIVGGVLLLFMTLNFVLAWVGAERVFFGEAMFVVDAGGWLSRHYYGFLRRQRHPVFWAMPAGVLFGALLVWALITVFILPGETRTVDLLAGAQGVIETEYAASGAFPMADDQRHLRVDANVLRDGFGRPFTYEVSGRWKLASWKLTSSGFDGKPSADDLCLSGSTKLVELVDKARLMAALLTLIHAGNPPLADRLAGVRALHCPTRD